MERCPLSFAMRWGAWLGEPRNLQTYLMRIRDRYPSLRPDVGQLVRGRMTFR
jgi:hypothetical protein